MHEMEKIRNEKLAKQLINALSLRNIEAFYAKDKEEALKKALEIIPEGSTVSCGGTMSCASIGLIDAMKNGNYNFLDRDGAPTPEEKKAIELKTFSDCDYFLASVNGIAENGVFVNVDGNANRVAAICQGPKHVLFVVGMNKVVRTEQDAYDRAKYVAAPINAQRFNLDTPCAKLGKCADCLQEQCICCQILFTRYSKHKDRIKMILVNEELGF